MIYRGWAKLCRPQAQGGIGIKEVLSWNKAVYAKWIWKLLRQPANLWSSWTTKYVLRGSDFWTAHIPHDCSWQWRSLLHLRDDFLTVMGSVTAVQTLLGPAFKASTVYSRLLGPPQACFWHKTVWDTASIPKHQFISYLAITNGLATIDNICSRGMQLPNQCVLCYAHSETAAHLYFTCPFSAAL
ncbi:hypothetical protein vseg_015215 [Gypsophila vaccaria]